MMKTADLYIKLFFGAGAGGVTFFLLFHSFFNMRAGYALGMSLGIAVVAFIIGINSRRR
ncbi:hypothetical protein K1Y38_24455 [Serratia marcescens]|uniref:hypothetical protein n=1 Tax=Serratia TaxID=613 RepID=UPI0018E81C9F|nr:MULTISPECIES: hypothetical protein [Serratia]EMB6256249.1 hypothetical protein [Serratia marcescens]MBJ2078287.1 hypothetical protein [Serratia ureilytica]MCW6015914.1 hypothetical protein [Serratia marcescens]MCW6023161.1 hypothetical protein [Serratia marcescens]MDP0522218.1 hypothetical protein [Serratia marcescens]